jgi:hypothetical protein
MATSKEESMEEIRSHIVAVAEIIREKEHEKLEKGGHPTAAVRRRPPPAAAG